MGALETDQIFNKLGKEIKKLNLNLNHASHALNTNVSETLLNLKISKRPQPFNRQSDLYFQ